MTLNLYVMPTMTVVTPKYTDIEPKYLSIFASFQWQWWTYGDEPRALVGIVNIDSATNNTLISQTGVTAVPTNLDQQVGAGGTLNNLRNGLETNDLPGTWVASTNTYRDVVRFVGACCQFMQRYQGLGLPFVFQSTVTLDTTYGTLPTQTQQGLLTAATSFGFATTTLIVGNTLRTIIQSMAQQYVAAGLSLTMCGIAL